jgi:hypothetical protein
MRTKFIIGIIVYCWIDLIVIGVISLGEWDQEDRGDSLWELDWEIGKILENWCYGVGCEELVGDVVIFMMVWSIIYFYVGVVVLS